MLRSGGASEAAQVAGGPGAGGRGGPRGGFGGRGFGGPRLPVVIGGLTTSLLITLVLVPTVYTIFEEGISGLWRRSTPSQA